MNGRATHTTGFAEDIPPQLRALFRSSAEVGRDMTLVQATGGNSSIKIGDRLWVKASGMHLGEADQRGVFVSLDLPALLNALAAGKAENYKDFVIDESGLRPSIETPLHALLPQAVVIHVHSVNTLAWACRSDGETALAPLLAGVRWAWIPYARPGEPLMLSVKARCEEGPDVLVLANHGIVVAGDDVEAAFRRLEDIERRLARPVRAAPKGDAGRLQAMAAASGYRPVSFPEVEAIATDDWRLAIAVRGSLYPDHVVFVGPPDVVDGAPSEPRSGARRWMIVPGAGVLVAPDISAAALDMLRCLGLVLERLDTSVPLNFLSKEDEGDLLGWEAEKYRQSLAPSTAILP